MLPRSHVFREQETMVFLLCVRCPNYFGFFFNNHPYAIWRFHLIFCHQLNTPQWFEISHSTPFFSSIYPGYQASIEKFSYWAKGNVDCTGFDSLVYHVRCYNHNLLFFSPLFAILSRKIETARSKRNTDYAKKVINFQLKSMLELIYHQCSTQFSYFWRFFAWGFFLSGSCNVCTEERMIKKA